LDLLGFLSTRNETGCEGEASHFLAGLLCRYGWEKEVKVEEVSPEWPNVVVRWPGFGGGPGLLLNGHVDTIPVGRAWPPVLRGRVGLKNGDTVP
jgi:acetylornithine deacetylase/succinyl-diaminopimelate desuccinylase-like protein